MCDCRVCQEIPKIDARNDKRANINKQHTPIQWKQLCDIKEHASREGVQTDDLAHLTHKLLQGMPNNTAFSLAIQSLQKAVCLHKTYEETQVDLMLSGIIFKHLKESGYATADIELEAIEYLQKSIKTKKTDSKAANDKAIDGFKLMGDYYSLQSSSNQFIDFNIGRKSKWLIQSICCYSLASAIEINKARLIVAQLAQALFLEGDKGDITILFKDPLIQKSAVMIQIIKSNRVLGQVTRLANVLVSCAAIFKTHDNFEQGQTYHTGATQLFSEYVDNYQRECDEGRHQELSIDAIDKSTISAFLAPYIAILKTVYSHGKNTGYDHFGEGGVQLAVVCFYLGPHIIEYEASLLAKDSIEWEKKMKEAYEYFRIIENGYDEAPVEIIRNFERVACDPEKTGIEIYPRPFQQETKWQIMNICRTLSAKLIKKATDILSCSGNDHEKMLLDTLKQLTEYSSNTYWCSLSYYKTTIDKDIDDQLTDKINAWKIIKIIIAYPFKYKSKESFDLYKRVLSDYVGYMKVKHLPKDWLEFYSYCVAMLIKNSLKHQELIDETYNLSFMENTLLQACSKKGQCSSHLIDSIWGMWCVSELIQHIILTGRIDLFYNYKEKEIDTFICGLEPLIDKDYPFNTDDYERDVEDISVLACVLSCNAWLTVSTTKQNPFFLGYIKSMCFYARERLKNTSVKNKNTIAESVDHQRLERAINELEKVINDKMTQLASAEKSEKHTKEETIMSLLNSIHQHEIEHEQDSGKDDRQCIRYLNAALKNYDAVLGRKSIKEYVAKQAAIVQKKDAALEKLSDHYLSLCEHQLDLLEAINLKKDSFSDKTEKKIWDEINTLIRHAQSTIERIRTPEKKQRLISHENKIKRADRNKACRQRIESYKEIRIAKKEKAGNTKIEERKQTALRLASDFKIRYETMKKKGDPSSRNNLKCSLSQYDIALGFFELDDESIIKKDILQQKHEVLEKLTDHYLMECAQHIEQIKDELKATSFSEKEAKKHLLNAKNSIEEIDKILFSPLNAKEDPSQKKRLAEREAQSKHITELDMVFQDKKLEADHHKEIQKIEEEIELSFLKQKESFISQIEEYIGAQILKAVTYEQDDRHHKTLDRKIDETEISKKIQEVLLKIQKQNKTEIQSVFPTIKPWDHAYKPELKKASSTTVAESKKPMSMTFIRTLVRYYFILKYNLCHMNTKTSQSLAKHKVNGAHVDSAGNELVDRLCKLCGIETSSREFSAKKTRLKSMIVNGREHINISSIFAMLTAQELLVMCAEPILHSEPSFFSKKKTSLPKDHKTTLKVSQSGGYKGNRKRQ